MTSKSWNKIHGGWAAAACSFRRKPKTIYFNSLQIRVSAGSTPVGPANPNQGICSLPAEGNDLAGLYNALIMLAMLFGGLGLMARSFRPADVKKDRS